MSCTQLGGYINYQSVKLLIRNWELIPPRSISVSSQKNRGTSSLFFIRFNSWNVLITHDMTWHRVCFNLLFYRLLHFSSVGLRLIWISSVLRRQIFGRKTRRNFQSKVILSIKKMEEVWLLFTALFGRKMHDDREIKSQKRTAILNAGNWYK